MDIFPPAQQRPALLALEHALDTSHLALRRDGCGDWSIMGEAGHIYAVPDGQYQIVVIRETPIGWTYAKRDFAAIGARLQNDGDMEGTAFITGLPNPAEAAIIRKLIHVRQRRHVSDAERERLGRLSAEIKFRGLSEGGFAA